MKRSLLLIGAGLALTSAWAIAQDTPESLLPPGFDAPAPKPIAASASQASPAGASSAPGASRTVRSSAQPADPAGPEAVAAAVAGEATGKPIRLPTLQELEALSPEELTELLGLKPTSDIPPAARREMKQVGILAQEEGGLPSASLAGQHPSLVRAALAGNRGVLVSRWGHILLRRALASRLDAPAGMNPADFVALRAALLVRMGEGEAARALVQDVDTANYTPALTQAALDAYVATADFTGICPAVTLQGGAWNDPRWQVSRAICAAFQGDSNAMAMLDRALSRGTMPRIDLLLAQKYAGAAGKVRRAVTIEWDGVTDMNPWRYGMTIAVGLQPPEALMSGTSGRYDTMAATAPMLGLSARAAAADRAASAGVLSSAAMVDLYSQIYAQDDVSDEWSGRAELLRNAYVGASPANRLDAMKQLWAGASGEQQLHSRQVLTAYAAARLPADKQLAGDAPALVASMLAAGLDRNALRWGKVVEEGSEAWGLLVLAAPGRSAAVDKGALSSFQDNDSSRGARKTAFLLAGLAGLGRVSPDTAKDLAADNGIDLYRRSRWSGFIQQAADVNNPTLVALLAGVGMQGTGWDKMTPRYLYNIVSALRRVGLEAEARMIAAEAVARA